MTSSCPALFISAPASHQGKTTVTAALACYHRKKGRRVRIFKTGPDFLDPMILERASGAPVYQLDLWMAGEAHCRSLLHEAASEADLILVEGVMGLFDGEPSSADLAELFGIPILAVINGAAMAQTFGAIAHGLATFRPSLPLAGVFANNVASERHFEMLRESLPPELRAVGWLKKDLALTLPERHLGLVQAEELSDLDERIEKTAAALQEVEGELPKTVEFSSPEPVHVRPLLEGIRIGVARDLAFSFLYRANLDLLRAHRAELCFFSPMADSEIPAVDALYLPGGYPEPHLEILEANDAMIEAVRRHHQAKKPIYAECGGMLYLLDSISHDARSGKMVGLIPGRAMMNKHLVNLGMHRVSLPEGELKGHTFHYSNVECPWTPLATSKGVRSGRLGEAFYRDGSLNASYLHLYFPSNPEAAAKLFAPTHLNRKV